MFYSNFLYAQPSFLEGLARVIDAGCVLDEYNNMRSSHEADSFAMWADWAAVGADIKAATEQFHNQLQLELASVEE